jgi:hypothetical protein
MRYANDNNWLHAPAQAQMLANCAIDITARKRIAVA